MYDGGVVGGGSEGGSGGSSEGAVAVAVRVSVEHSSKGSTAHSSAALPTATLPNPSTHTCPTWWSPDRTPPSNPFHPPLPAAPRSPRGPPPPPHGSGSDASGVHCSWLGERERAARRDEGECQVLCVDYVSLVECTYGQLMYTRGVHCSWVSMCIWERTS